MREAVLFAPKKRERIADEETHRLAAARKRHPDLSLVILRKGSNQSDNEVSRSRILFGRADVGDLCALGIVNDMDHRGIEFDLTAEAEVSAEGMKLPCLRVQQISDSSVAAVRSCNEMDFSRRFAFFLKQCVKRLCYDLRRHADHGDKDASRIFHHLSPAMALRS